MWLFGPGLAIGLAARLRGLALWAMAPALSTAGLAVLAIVFGLTGLPWQPLSAGIGAVVVAAAVWALSLVVRPGSAPTSAPRGAPWLVPAGVAVGAVLTALRLALYIGDPDNPSQTNDAVFHLNALRYIADTGSASSLDLTGMLGATTIYPAGWHAPASLVFMMGTDIVVAANAMSLVIGGAVWTLGVAWLTLVATRGDRLAAAAAAALAAAAAAFPLLMIQWGVLYPSLLAIAILPAALASILELPQRWSSTRWRGVIWGAGLAGVAALGVALAQPSILVIWGIAGTSFGMWLVVSAWRSAAARTRIWLVAAALGQVAVLVCLWWLLGRFVTSEWPPSRGKLEAVLDVLSNSLVGFPREWALSALMLVGLIASVRVAHLRWLATSWAMVAALYFVAVAVGNATVRAFLLAPFYGDPYRVAAALPVVVIPLAGIGAAALAGLVGGLIQRRRDLPHAPAATVGAATLAALAVAGLISIAVSPIIQWRDVWTGAVDRVTWYTMADDSYLTPDERALLGRLNAVVAPGDVIVGNPSTGMAFGFAIGDHTVYPLTWQPPQTAAYDVLASNLNEVATDPAVCPAVESIGARYVLDFGPGETEYGRYILPGFTDIAARDGFELVDRQGDAVLWRITACG
ncbi:DUF6541 family protein [Microbacterium sp. C23T]